MLCPICQSKSTPLIIDLLECNSCAHIFKKEPHEPDVKDIQQIHTLKDPVTDVRNFCETFGSYNLEFIFYSLMFNILELRPNQFYKYYINHYFNQMSLMIFLKRCGLAPIEQRNIIEGKWCLTKLKVKKEK